MSVGRQTRMCIGPRIEDRDIGCREVYDVARDDAQILENGNRGDEQIGLCKAQAHGAALLNEATPDQQYILIDGTNAVGKPGT